MSQEGQRQDSHPRLTMLSYHVSLYQRGVGKENGGELDGPMVCFSGIQPQGTVRDCLLFPWQRGGVWSRKGRLPVPSGSAEPGQTRNFLQNRAVTCRAAVLLTALDMTLISYVHGL